MSFLILFFLLLASVGLVVLAKLRSSRRKVLRLFMEAIEQSDIGVALFESERSTEPDERRRTESIIGVAAGLPFRLSITTDQRRGVRDFRLIVCAPRFRAQRVPVDDIKHPFSLMYLRLKRLLKRRGIKTG